MAAVTTAVALGVGAAVSVAGSVESNRQARKKGRLIRDETEEALELKEDEINRFQGVQTTAFAKSGVLLEGTPLEVLEETRRQGDIQKGQIKRGGKIGRDNANAQGRQALLNGVGAIAEAGTGIAKAGAGGF